MRRPVALVVVALLLFAGVPWSAQGIHTDPGLHAEKRSVQNVTSVFYLHCSENQLRQCEDGGTRSLQAAGLPDEGTSATDAGQSAGRRYRFLDARTGRDKTANAGVLRELTATIHIDDQLANSSNFTLELLVDRNEVGQAIVDSKGLGTNAYTFEIGFPGGLEIPDNAFVAIVIHSGVEEGGGRNDDGSWALRLHDPDHPSRVAFHGTLLSTRAWLEPPSGGTATRFNLVGTRSQRQFTPVVSVHPVFGNSTLSPVADPSLHNETGGSVNFSKVPDTASARMDYEPINEGVDDLEDETEGCNDADLQTDDGRSNYRRTVLSTLPSKCTVPSDQGLTGNYTARFEIEVPEVHDRGLLRCPEATGSRCVDDHLSFILFAVPAELELDRDEAVKGVLPGETVHYNVRLTNRLATSRTFDISVTDPPSGWTAGTSSDTLTLGPGNSVTIDVRVTPPSDASANSDVAVDVQASIPDFPDPSPVTLTTVVASQPTYGASLHSSPDVAGAALGQNTTFLVDVTNDGTTRETFHLSMPVTTPGLAGNLTTTIPTRSLTLDAGERRQVRVHVKVSGDVPDRFIGTEQPLPLRVRSVTTGSVVADESLDIRIQATFDFAASLRSSVHKIETVWDPQSTATTCTAEATPVGQTTWGSWYRVTINNTGGNPDTLSLALGQFDVNNSDTAEKAEHWDAEIYTWPDPERRPQYRVSQLDLSGGDARAVFYVLLLRDRGDLDGSGRGDQCETEETSHPWRPGERVDIPVRVQSKSLATNRERFRLTIQADDTASPGAQLDKEHRPSRKPEPGRDPLTLTEIPDPVPVAPGEPRQLTFRLTNTGRSTCTPANGMSLFFVGLPGWDWEVVSGAARLGEGFTGLEKAGPGGGTIRVSGEDLQFTLEVVPDSGEVGQRFRSEVAVTANCNDEGPLEIDERAPLTFEIARKDGLDSPDDVSASGPAVMTDDSDVNTSTEIVFEQISADNGQVVDTGRPGLQADFEIQAETIAIANETENGKEIGTFETTWAGQLTDRQGTIEIELEGTGTLQRSDQVGNAIPVQRFTATDGTALVTVQQDRRILYRETLPLDRLSFVNKTDPGFRWSLKLHDSLVLPEDGKVPVVPGGEAMGNLQIHNTGSTRPLYNVTLLRSSLPDGWEAHIEGLRSLTVPPSSVAHVPIRISAPSGASPGDVGPITANVTADGGNLTAEMDLVGTAVDPGGLALRPETVTKGIEPGKAKQYKLNLTNAGQTAFQVKDGSVAVLGQPEGWEGTVLHDDSPSFNFSLAPGASTTLTLEVAVPAGELNVSTVATTVAVSGSDRTVSASVKTHIATVFSVDLSALQPSKAVRAGHTARYGLQLTNTGNGVDSFTLSHGQAPQGWTVDLARSSAVLGARETASIPFTVTPPHDASPGVTVPIQVTATSRSNPSKTASLDVVTAVASYDPELHGDPDLHRVGPGEPTDFEVTLKNNGTGTDTIRLAAVSQPSGWTVNFSNPSPNLEGNTSRTITVTVAPSPTASARSEGIVVVEARSTFSSKTDAMTFRVKVLEYLARDVDDDGIPEAVVDDNQDPTDGYERFLETSRRRGIVSTQVLTVDGDDDGAPDFWIDTADDPLPDVYWSPLGDVFTEAIFLDVQGDGRDEALVDYDGDGRVDAAYFAEQARANVAEEADIDGDTANEYLVDTDGDGLLDAYLDTGEPRPGTTVRTQTALVTGNQYAVDTDGDGTHDQIYNTQSGTVRSFTLADGFVQFATTYWYALVLFAIVVVLFAGLKLSEPKRRYIYDDYD